MCFPTLPLCNFLLIIFRLQIVVRAIPTVLYVELSTMGLYQWVKRRKSVPTVLLASSIDFTSMYIYCIYNGPTHLWVCLTSSSGAKEILLYFEDSSTVFNVKQNQMTSPNIKCLVIQSTVQFSKHLLYFYVFSTTFLINQYIF